MSQARFCFSKSHNCASIRSRSKRSKRHPRQERSSEVKCVLQDRPPPLTPIYDSLAQILSRKFPFMDPSSQNPSLEERIASGEFTKRTILTTTQPLRDFLSEMGPFGRWTAFQIAQFCRNRRRRSRMSIPEASGSLAEMADKPFFEPLYDLFQTYGGIFKLSFGPQSFVIVSDPNLIRNILVTSADQFSKGILSDILEFVMGNGLIPSNGEIWVQRRRAILPSLHKSFIENMIHTFVECTERGLQSLEASIQSNTSIEMESFFSRLALDIIGRAVFNYDFDATTHDDPVIKAVYRVLREAEYRSLQPMPWWKLPLVDVVIPQQREVKAALKIINETLDRLVQTVHEMIEKDSSSETANLSILHFLIASGEVVSAQQLRDDLMTLLIAGHETTAAVLTWTFFELSKRPDLVQEMQDEIDVILANRPVTATALLELDLCTRVIAESMRMYPQPPVLIRKSLSPVQIGKYSFPENTDFFLSVWNLHRSEALWENPHEFNPNRFPKNSGMPNETTTHFKYLPFGGGKRKCIGAQFALLESLEIVASILQKYDFEMAADAPEVRLTTGATIHSTNGLYLKFKPRMRHQATFEASEGGSKSISCPYHRTKPSSLESRH